jgi:hypothetical protein
MTRCINYGTIAGFVQAGGMTGRLDGGTVQLTDCINYGSCKAQGGDAAGMIAQNMKAVTLTGCINYGRHQLRKASTPSVPSYKLK